MHPIQVAILPIVVSAFVNAVSFAQEELKDFQLHPDCIIELVAKEPNVVDPVAIRFDERGRLWVVEMRDYPTLNSELPNSKIKILEDKDGDGFFETVTVFADQLMFPTGIQPWKNGVIVTLAGKVVFLADHNNDRICDEQKILFRGFAEKNTQLRANHPTLGPDGKVYIANGLRNGEIQGPGASKPLSINGMDFRFDPNTLEFEAVTGYGQFGLTFDEAGNRYTCTNRNPLKRVVFENEYLQSAKGVRVSQSVVDVAAAGPESRLYPISETWTTSNLHANQFTAACGVHIYDGISLPEEFTGNAFTCDPTANVVHREIISFESDKVIGHAKPGRSEIEFLASGNPEFRPVNLAGGPDGALYLVDMRRTVIEHPQFMPPELKARPDLRGGSHLGRIYRIKRKNAPKGSRLATNLDPEKDVFSGIGWKRETAHRLMVQNIKKVKTEQLVNGIRNPASHPNGLIRAMTFLQGQGALSDQDLKFAISHYSAAVRRVGIKLCEKQKPEWIRDGITDENDQVRFQALLSSSRCGIFLPTSTLKLVALNTGQNSWIRTALLIAAKSQPGLLLNELVKELVNRKNHRNRESIVAICIQLAPYAAADDKVQTRNTLLACFRNIVQTDDSLKQIAFAISQTPQIRGEMVSILSQEIEKKELGRLRTFLQKGVEEKSLKPVNFQLLALVSKDDPLIRKLALDGSKPGRQLAAVRALHLFRENGAWILLAKQFRSLGLPLRSEVLKASYSRKSVAWELLEQVKANKLSWVEFSIDSRKRLQNHSDEDVKRFSRQVLTVAIPLDRSRAYEKYKAALALKPKAIKGKPVFEKACASCHQLGDLGNRIGPDISDTRTKSKSQLLLDIIRPNAAIDNNYVEYLVETTSGSVLKGIVIENNATGITLKQADNKSIIVPRENIDRVQSSGQSLMPVGLEQGLSLQQIANLISYLQNWRYLDQNIPFEEDKNAK